MILSTKGRYGLRAMVDLAVHSEDGPVSIHSIAGRQNIAERYLEQLIGKLKKAGLVRSVRGASGGYLLAKKPEEISVGEVLLVLEGDLKPIDCAGLDEENVSCEVSGSCVTKYVWQKIYRSIEDTVNHIYLDELVALSRALNDGFSVSEGTVV
ncbi:MAG: Rrf2 family transcriptional regulator [Lachnospiraceae bacterium]|nr:Rrf2 family transcriptional regulator [Lachnospiraceae bacterium]